MLKKNAVIGVSVNFDEYQLKNFILSFREVNIHDDLIMFVVPEQIPVLETCFYKYNVIFKPFCFADILGTKIHNARYIKVLEFLYEQTAYKNIFLSDTKDVIFQYDPFRNLESEFLYFFQEDTGIKYRDELEYNGGWIREGYGQAVLDSMLDYNIICSGTILGSYSRVIKLLVSVKDEFVKIKTERPSVFASVILDQAVVNYICRMNEEISNISTIKHNGDIVATIGVSLNNDFPSLDKVSMNKYHILLNDLDPSIIHQYDRHPMLKEIFDKKYILS